jgi:hypothetical protein
MPLQRLFSGAAGPRVPSATAARGELPLSRVEGDHPVPATATTATTATATATTATTTQAVQPAATLQRAEAGDAAAAAPEQTPPVAPPAAGVTAARSAAVPGAPGGTDLDELARRLYAPMAALLRAELWVDRERSGRSMTR